MRKLYLMAIAMTMAALTGCNKEDDPKDISVTGVTLSPTTADLTTGSTLTE